MAKNEVKTKVFSSKIFCLLINLQYNSETVRSNQHKKQYLKKTPERIGVSYLIAVQLSPTSVALQDIRFHRKSYSVSLSVSHLLFAVLSS